MKLYVIGYGIVDLPDGQEPAQYLRDTFEIDKEIQYAPVWWQNPDNGKWVAPLGLFTVKELGQWQKSGNG